MEIMGRRFCISSPAPRVDLQSSQSPQLIRETKSGARRLAWSRKDEDGLFEEFFSVDLEKTDIPLFNVLSQLLSETEELEKRAVDAEEQLKVVDSKLEKIAERVDDLQNEKDGLEDKLIAKFAVLMDTVKSAKK